MARKNLFQRIRDWFTGGNSRASSSRGSSATRTRNTTYRANNTFFGGRTNEEEERRKAERERQAKIKEAFATSAQKAREKERNNNNSFKSIFKASDSAKAWKNTAKKDLNVTDAKSNRLAQLDNQYWQKQEQHSAKYNPIGLSMAKGAVSGVTLNADKLLTKADKNVKANQDKVQKIMEKSGGKKAVKRANVAGEVAGNLATFGLGTAGARGTIEGSKAVAKASAKLANSEIIKKASARAIEKGLAKGSIEEVSQQLAKKIATELGADVAVDNTIGLVDAGTRSALAKKGERGKEFIENVGINALATGTLDLAPTLVKGLKGAKSLKNVEKKEIEKAVEEAVENVPIKKPKVKGEYTKADADELETLVKQKDEITEQKRQLQLSVQRGANADERNAINKEFQELVVKEKNIDKEIGKNNAKYEAIVGSTKKPAIEPKASEVGSNEVKTAEKQPVETTNGSITENEIKAIQDAEPLEPKAEKPTAKPVEEAVQDSKAELPAVEQTAKAELPNNGANPKNELKSYDIDVTTFGTRQDIKGKNIEEYLGNLDDVKPASVHQADGHFGEINKASTSEVMAIREAQEKAKALANENGERVTDSAVTSYALSGNKEFQDEAVAKMEELGITAKDGEMNMLERNSNHLYDPKYKKLSYKQMCATAREDVYNNPKAVMQHLYSLMQSGDRFTAVDLALSAQLVEYGDRYGVRTASDLGHMFLMDYANEMGRISGMYQFISRQWNLLSSEKKIDYLYKQMKSFSQEMNLGSIDDIKEAIQSVYANKVNKNGEDIYTALMKDRTSGNFQFTEENLVKENPSVLDVLLDNIIHSDDEEFVKKAKAELWQTINGTVEPTFLNNLMTWRYFSMLGNPATHARNIAGNAINLGARSIADVFTTGIENMLYATGKIDSKTRALLTPTEIKEVFDGKGKYGEVINSVIDEDVQSIMKSSQGYKNKIIDEFGTANLNTIEKGVQKSTDVIGNWLEMEDKVFVETNYRKSLAQFLKANGYGTGANNPLIQSGRFADDEAILQAGRAWASQDATEATFRNFNEMSQALNKQTRAGTKINATGYQKFKSVAINSIIPFTTTPINILVQGAKFSPLGLAHHGIGLMKATSPEQYLKHAEGLGAGLTGTGVLALGMWLSSNNSETVKGIQFVSSAKDDERAKALKRAGYQDYSVVFTDGDGHGISYSLEWCSPIAQTLFTGVELGRMMRGGLKAGDSSTAFDSFGSITQIASRMVDPTLQMSVLQGVNTFIEGANNDSGISGAVSGITALAQNYLGSLIPSFMGALARSVSPYDYNLVGTSSTEMGSNLEYTLNAQKAKLPFVATKMLAPKVNEKGEIVGKKENAGDYAKAFAKNMLSVGKYQKIDMTDADKDALKTYDEAIADGVDPDTAKKVFAKVDYSTEKKIGKTDKRYGIKKETLNLDKWERATAQQNRSKNGADVMDALLKSKAWNAQVDKDSRESREAEMRAKAPKSTSEALDILVNTKEYKNANPDEKVAMRDAILDKGTKYSANKEAYMNRGNTEADYRFLEDVPARVQAEYNKGKLADIVSKEQLVDAVEKMAKVSISDDGTRRTYYSKASMLDYLDKADLSEKQKEAIYNALKNKNAKPYGSSGGSRRSGRRRSGSSKKKTTTTSKANLSAFKPSVKDSDFKSIVNGANTTLKGASDIKGLSDAELQAIIKQANRDSLKVRGK
jgi:hypothetical protein